MSYLFYSAWSFPFLILLLITTISTFFSAKFFYETTKRSIKKSLLIFCLLLNFGILAYFKYGNFLIDNLNYFLSNIGIQFQLVERNIIVPIGISFYTFQTISYLIDIYRKSYKPWNSILDYSLYVTFFPQLVAGPITRASYFLSQCESSRKADFNQLCWGLTLFIIGLFAKVFIADELASPIVQTVYDTGISANFLSSWVGTVAFSVQIFCDFFGYSTCAIGIGLTLGFNLPENFKYPYSAKGFSDFWKRWHISLSTWLRDYLYISIGGNRKGAHRTYINLFVTMLLGGLWHGASWMFVIWGGLHGFYLILERNIRSFRISRWKFWDTKIGEILIILSTFTAVTFAWVFFRANDIQTAYTIAYSMINLKHAFTSIYSSLNYKLPFGESIALGLTNLEYITVLCLALFILISHYCLRFSSLEKFIFTIPWWVRSLIIGSLFLFTVTCMSGEDRAFIYFQF
jgi:D-alanyl-lipoteichoic acid acyltransferase DltB (MBOAT superfamily)